MGDFFNITFKIAGSDDMIATAETGVSLLDAAKAARVPIDAPCSGNGACGKCKVRLLSGKISAPPNRHVTEREAAEGVLLACAAKPAGDLTVRVPEASLLYRSGMRITDFSDERGGNIFSAFRRRLESLGYLPDRDISLVEARLAPPTLDNPMADQERLQSALEATLHTARGAIRLSAHALRVLARILRASDYDIWCVLRAEDAVTDGVTRCYTVLDVMPGTTKPIAAGLALDIGTTTVSALLVDLLTGEPLASGSAGNGQIRYGADVINRLIESARPGGLERLRSAVTDDCITPLVERICLSRGMTPAQIYRVAFAGNTTMTHLFLGAWANFIRLEPYVPAFFRLEGLRGADIGIGVNDGADVLAAPCAGSYVGGDITAGVFASMMNRRPDMSLFIDLGTNGELVYGGAEFLVACACSAGPAFEGGDISCGMRAAYGAIEAFRIDGATLEPTLTVIGAPDAKPAGICGSGLIDIVCELFRAGVIDAKGRIVREGARIIRDDTGLSSYVLAFAGETGIGRNIEINETDIDNFIRAKGSIYSAIRCLLATTDTRESELDAVYVAGGIGSGIDIGSAIRIGMLPNLPAERFHYLGNTSLTGAYAMLMSRNANAEVNNVCDGMTYLELSAYPGYMDEFVAACFLPHTDASLFPAAEAERT